MGAAEILIALGKGVMDIIGLLAQGKVTDEQALEHLRELTAAIPVRAGEAGTARALFDAARARIRSRAGK